MQNRILPSKRRHEGGQTILLVAIALVSLLGMAALAIDVVTLYVASSEIQRAADATALAAAKGVADSGFTTLQSTDPNYANASLLAQQMATAAINAMTSAGAPNLVAGAVPLVVGSPTIDLSHQGDARITVTLNRANLPTFFSKIWGRSAASVTATAAAEAYNPANSNLPAFTRIAPTSLKPWLVANVDPLHPTNQLVNPVNGAVELGVTGEIFNLTADCQTSGLGSCALLDNPPGIPSVPTGIFQVEYVPLLVADPSNPKNVCPACTVGPPYEQSIECADVNTYVTPTCGGGAGANNALWDNSVNPGGPSGYSATGAECLIHASASGSGNGQDLLNEPLIIFSGPAQITAKSGPQNGNLVTTSNSIVTIPILDRSAAIPVTGTLNVTVVGYMQAFINQVDDGTAGTNPGDINIRVLNVAGCGATPNNAAAAVVGGGGTSPVPVRLITPP